MLLEGRKHPRTPERFLVQISSVHDPRLEELASVENLSSRGARIKTERFGEPGSPVDVKSYPGELRGRARVAYCQTVGDKVFSVGLNFLSQTGDWKTRSSPLTDPKPQ